MEEVEPEVDQRARQGAALEPQVLLVQVPAARPGHDHRHVVGVLDGVVPALGRRQLEGAADGVEEVDLATDDVAPVRGVGVLEVGEPHLRPGVQRVDRHLALGGPGDLHPPVAQVRRHLRHLPLPVAHLAGLVEEVEPAGAGDLLASLRARGQQLVAPGPEPPLQLPHERQGLGGQDRRAALDLRAVHREGLLCHGGLPSLRPAGRHAGRGLEVVGWLLVLPPVVGLSVSRSSAGLTTGPRLSAMEASISASAPGVAVRDRPLWKRTWLVVLVLGLTAFVAFVVWRGASTVYYVVMAWFIALAMEPAVAKLATRMRRGLATGVVMIVAGLALLGFVAAFGALFVNQLVEFAQALPDVAADALAWFNRVTGSNFTFENLLDEVGISTGDLAGYAQDVALYLVGLVVGLVSSAFGVFVMLFFVFYISAGMPSLRTWLARRMNPGMQVPFLAAWDLTKIKVGGYIAARIVLASINSVCSGIVFALIGLPYWLPLALWTGLVAQFIPNIGTYISIALPVLVGLTSDNPMLGVYVLIWGIAYQQVENLTIEPRISARAVDLHPAVSFGSALLGAQLFGLSGALLGVPVAATVMAMLEIYKRRYELSATTEERVAVLVAPRSERGEGRDTAEPVTVAAREVDEPRPDHGPREATTGSAAPDEPAGAQVHRREVTAPRED